MLFSRRRVEEDLERIRRANLPEAERLAEEAQDRETARRLKEAGQQIGAKDLFAMVIAVLSLILPYLLVFLLVMYLFSRLIFR